MLFNESGVFACVEKVDFTAFYLSGDTVCGCGEQWFAAKEKMVLITETINDCYGYCVFLHDQQ